MTPQQFIAKWQRVHLSERSACQQHFLDLCELLGQPKPAEADPEGQWYTFERGVTKTEGGNGWADVWKRGHFGWEYKRKHRNLKEAYNQLLLYREDLENPPLLVVCDMDRFEVHTNFTATAKRKYEFDLAGLAEPANLDVLRKLFTDPESLRPGITSETITVDAAKRFGELADAMRQKGIEPLQAAHFLMKLMFCMFGEDVGLLPSGLFTRLLDDGRANPASLNRRLENLFAAMGAGGDFGAVEIPWFNGGLFADNDVIPMTVAEINTLVNVNKFDWASVEPSIFGTLFERTLDPEKRSQIGAHYTSRADIETLLKPVLLAPLRREWEEVRRKCEEVFWPRVVKASRPGRVGQAKRGPTTSSRSSPQRKAFDRAILNFAERLHHVTVLDPACGSGNFLYVAIHMLLDLEREVIAYAAARGLPLVPHVGPAQLSGLEINPYAQQLAQVVIWIGYLQWMHYNGFKMPDHPVLSPIESIRRQDAILDLSDPDNPKEPEWPEAEFIVGNPPFLGGKLLRTNLGDEYVDAMFRAWNERVPREADLCCYWFEKARQQIERKKCSRAGLLATQ
ncbi:MAG: class I SAM-dependent DNA methyltransferase, partial [Planctomycetes bacterium]|nr:class I SAM-dependent DNA methyltransferase [Planctomycetota bacterium]